MALVDQTTLRVVLYEGSGADELSDADRYSLMNSLLEQGYSVTRTSSRGMVAPRGRAEMMLLGRFQQTPPDASDEEGSVAVRDISGLDAGAAVMVVNEVREARAAAKQGEWKPWFPVIDYDRCTNCMQCLSFCLFGVYGVDDEKKIQVQNNDNCKTNCPACSRVCPEAAIMFPKYKSGPINGDIVSSQDLEREKMKIDISALLGGDVYAMLRTRSERAQSRFSKERDSDKALQERQRCLTKLAQAGDIPHEVLLSLPGPEEIQRRAAEAMARAEAARGGS